MIAIALFAIVVTALAAYSLGHSAGVRLERGRHVVEGMPTQPSLSALYPTQHRETRVSDGERKSSVRVSIGVIAGPRSTYPIGQWDLFADGFDASDAMVVFTLQWCADYSTRCAAESFIAMNPLSPDWRPGTECHDGPIDRAAEVGL